MAKLREMVSGPEPVLAPLVLNPLMGKLAEKAGFRALYLGGGAPDERLPVAHPVAQQGLSEKRALIDRVAACPRTRPPSAATRSIHSN